MADDLGTCWWEECTLDGHEVVRGVPVAATDRTRVDLVAAASRITRLGLVACPNHAAMARTLAEAS